MHDEPDALDRIETLAYITAQAVQRMEKQLDGNGRPGVIEDVAVLKHQMSRRTKIGGAFAALVAGLATILPIFLT